MAEIPTPYIPETNPTRVADKLGVLLKRRNLTNQNMLEGLADAQAVILTLRGPQEGDDPEEITVANGNHPLYLGFSRVNSFRDPLLGFPDAASVAWAYPIATSEINPTEGYGLQFRQQKSGRYAGIVTQYTFRQPRSVGAGLSIRLDQPLRHQVLEKARVIVIGCIQQKEEAALIPA